MENVINVFDILGTEVRSRSNAERIRDKMLLGSVNIINLRGIEFLSRSFADELYNIINESSGTKISNAIGAVNNMLEIVKSSRQQKRVRRNENSDIKEFDDVDSFLTYVDTF